MTTLEFKCAPVRRLVREGEGCWRASKAASRLDT